MKPTLLILAAGSATRYGGLKQLEPLGPGGETIIEYSIYDALKAEFGKVVLIIRKEFLNDFEERFSKYKNQIEMEYAFQEVNPKFEEVENLSVREKPWGTVHAVLSASEQINEPFAVINADDFYGRESFKLMAEFLKNNCSENVWTMIGYQLKNTLSEHGGVTRGACELDEIRFLKKVKECRDIRKKEDGIIYNENDSKILLDENAIVSMNFWGFHPQFFEVAEEHFRKFVCDSANDPKSEMTIPDLVQLLIEDGTLRVTVMQTKEKWFGVTYKKDKESVVSKLKALVAAGVYPEKLWK